MILFDKASAKSLKGIAILLMVFHHCFRKASLYDSYPISFFPFPEEFIVGLSAMSKLCVSVFAFISGYGLFLSYSEQVAEGKGEKVTTKAESEEKEILIKTGIEDKKVLAKAGIEDEEILAKTEIEDKEILAKTKIQDKEEKLPSPRGKLSASRWVLLRYIKTFSGYWFIYVFALVLSLLQSRLSSLYFSDGFWVGCANALADFLGVANLLGTPTLKGTWWYMSAALVFILLMPLLYQGICTKPWVLWMGSIILPLVLFSHLQEGSFPGTTSVYSFLPVFLLGAVFARTHLFARWGALLQGTLGISNVRPTNPPKPLENTPWFHPLGNPFVKKMVAEKIQKEEATDKDEGIEAAGKDGRKEVADKDGGIEAAGKDLGKKKLGKKEGKFMVELILLFLCYPLYQHLPLKTFWSFHYCLFPALFILFCAEFVLPLTPARKVFPLLGEHSMNIFLLHNFLRTGRAGKLLYSSGHFLIVVAGLFLLSLLLSMGLELLKKKLHYPQAIRWICHRIVSS